VNDEIRLVVPAEEDFRPIVHLVVGGLAVRLDLTMDALEDLQVALDALLAHRDDEGAVEVRVTFDPNAMRASVGPLPAAILDDVEHDGSRLGLRRVLETVCDTFEVEHRNGETWVELSKHTEAPTPAGG
jgi:anti-sigma regulatory factor (Ser/Thr protein kinase)